MTSLSRLLFRLPLLALFFIAACASGVRPSIPFDPQTSAWQGRISVRVKGEQAQSFSAQFTLQGDSTEGQLTLSTPLGSTVAQIRWSHEGALLLGQGEPRRFDTLDALTRALTGAALPIDGLFVWLKGGHMQATGWQVERADLAEGLLTARRDDTHASVELKLLLEH